MWLWPLGWRIYLLLFPLIWNSVSIQSHSIKSIAHSFITYSPETQTSKLILTPAQTVKKGEKSDKNHRLILSCLVRKFVCIVSCSNIFSGWFIVWKMFLIRFSFIRELVYGGGNDKSSNNTVPATPLRRSSRIRDLKSRKSKTDN